MKQVKLKLIVGALAVALSGCVSVPVDENTHGGAYGGAGNGQASMGVQTSGIGADGSRYFLGSNFTTRAPSNQSFFYNFDSNQVHQEYMPAIYAQAAYLVGHPDARVRLEGHTDSRGSRAYNQALGYRRARAVFDILKMKGVQSSQVQVISYGEEKPMVEGDSEAAFKMNRRVDLIFVR